MNRLISQGQAMRSVLGRARVTHFIASPHSVHVAGVQLEPGAGAALLVFQAPGHDPLRSQPEELRDEVGEARVDLVATRLVELDDPSDLERPSTPRRTDHV